MTTFLCRGNCSNKEGVYEVERILEAIARTAIQIRQVLRKGTHHMLLLPLTIVFAPSVPSSRPIIEGEG